MMEFERELSSVETTQRFQSFPSGPSLDANNLLQRIEKKLGYRSGKQEEAGVNAYDHRLAIHAAKNVLAQELGWVEYDPTKKITDSRVLSLIREQKKAYRTGNDWDVSDVVNEAMSVFLQERQAYQRSKNAHAKHGREAEQLTALAEYVQCTQGVTPEAPAIDGWVEKTSRKKRPDALSRDLLNFVSNQHNKEESVINVLEQVSLPTQDDQGEVREDLGPVRQEGGNIKEAPEGRTRGFLNRLRSPLKRFKEIPNFMGGAATALKTEARHLNKSMALLAVTSLTAFTLSALVFSGKVQVPESLTIPSMFSSRVSQVQVIPETPTPEPAPQENLEGTEKTIPENCPYYDVIVLYRDWNPELVCKIAQVSSNNNPEAEKKNADGSYGMGVLQINSEEMKKMNPEIDPEHLKVAIREDPAQGITWAHYGYKIRGYSALSACANGQIDCWSLESSQGLPLVPDTPSQYRDVITEAALEYGVPPRLLASLLSETSGFDPSVVSADRSAGIGLFQPETARELGIDPLDPIASTGGAAKYLRQQFDRFGNWPDAVGAYHAGPSVVAENQGIPPDYQKTRRYVSSVIGGFSKNDQSP